MADFLAIGEYLFSVCGHLVLCLMHVEAPPTNPLEAVRKIPTNKRPFGNLIQLILILQRLYDCIRIDSKSDTRSSSKAILISVTGLTRLAIG